MNAAFAFILALGCVIVSNSSRIPTGELRHFLELRITIANAAFAGLFTLFGAFVFDALDIYRHGLGLFCKGWRLLLACGLMTVVLAWYLIFSHTTGPTLRIVATFFCISFLYEVTRLLISRRLARRRPRHVVILGSGRRAAKAWREIRTRYHGVVDLLGFVDDRSTDEMPPDIRARFLGNVEALEDLLFRNPVDDLLVALPARSCYEMAQATILTAERIGVRVIFLHDFYTSSISRSSRIQTDVFSELVPLHPDHCIKLAFKRVLDVIGSSMGIVLLSPLFLAISIVIKATSDGPIFFIQDRYGFRRRVFRILKFRTMVNGASDLQRHLDSQATREGIGFKMENDPRVTRFGRLLRTFSLDELPQLLNVFLGHMSLVGPRPLATTDVHRFGDATCMRRFSVKPGLTGLWQVSGRSALTFSQAMNLDMLYIDDWSLMMDFKILLRTIPAVTKRVGAV